MQAHTLTHTGTHTHTHRLTHTCRCTYSHMQAHTHTHAGSHSHMQAHTHTQVHTLAHSGAHTLAVLMQLQITVVVVHSLSHVQLFSTPWIAARQASLSFTISQSFEPMSIKSVMPSNHLILRCPLLLLSIFPSIRVFSNKLVLHIRWLKY